MSIEFELKFRATPEILQAVASDVTGTFRSYAMATTYYDTPDRALSRQSCTLRRRMENERSVCTLKMPAGALGRREFELECDSIQGAIPELCKLSGFAVLEELSPHLTELCAARFNRIAITVDVGDCIVELALDSGVLLGGGREEPLCELEVELKSGSREAAVTYANLLALRYGLQQERKSKFYRASLLAGGI